ncbi:host attachment family protein [Roseinatronobacter sp.]|uniref:host attachment family protein n=1 Tax=Roseinatronobacter sp. TaxID=1945755 RepID=UPI0025DE59B8|nr:host attachment family protein [Roseibaca sp.]
MNLEHDTWVVVADGEKYLLLRNKGDQEFMNLEVVDHDTSTNPPARELATDRAGRQHDSKRHSNDGVQSWGKSAMQETDWHRVEEERFAEDVAEKLLGLSAAGQFRHLLVIADPRSLGAMRNAYGDRLAPAIIAEIGKDLTNLPLDKIEASIKAWDGG